MAIHITRVHGLGRAEARRRIEQMAGHMTRTLGISYYWQGDRLVFRRTGARGTIEVSDRDVAVHLEKSLLVPIPEARLREQIEAELERSFG